VDTITHLALGACIGEVIGTKRLGKKALVVGALAQLIPDIDFLCALWMDPSSNALAHRGFTHSLLFTGLASAFLAGWCHWKWRRPETSFRFWWVLLGTEILVHIFLDAFNAYGTGWFEPFSHYRVSFNTLFVADPFYSLPLGIVGLALVMLKLDYKKRMYWSMTGIVISTLYLGYGIYNKLNIDKAVAGSLKEQHIPDGHYFTTPTPFNNWLWYIVASTDSGSYVGHRSVFDKTDHVSFKYFPRNESLLEKSNHADVIARLKRFSNGYYTIEFSGDTLTFNDLRFGQMTGWENPNAGFVFHYYLEPDLDNRLVLQRGRFAFWDQETTWALLRRINGI